MRTTCLNNPNWQEGYQLAIYRRVDAFGSGLLETNPGKQIQLEALTTGPARLQRQRAQSLGYAASNLKRTADRASWPSISFFKVTLHLVWLINRSYMVNTCSAFALLYCLHFSVVFCCYELRRLWVFLARLLCRRAPSLVMYQHGFCSYSYV